MTEEELVHILLGDSESWEKLRVSPVIDGILPEPGDVRSAEARQEEFCRHMAKGIVNRMAMDRACLNEDCESDASRHCALHDPSLQALRRVAKDILDATPGGDRDAFALLNRLYRALTEATQC